MKVHERSHAHVCGMHRVLEAFVAAVTSAAAAHRHGRTARTDKERWSDGARLPLAAGTASRLLHDRYPDLRKWRAIRPQEGTKGITKLRYLNE